MSHFTDLLRAQHAAALGRQDDPPIAGQMLDDVIARAKIQRRALLRGSFGATLAAVFGAGALTACGGGDDDPAPVAGEDYGVRFEKVSAVTNDTVTVPEGYVAEVLFAAGDAVVAGSTGYSGGFIASAQGETVAGHQHDGMHFFELPNVDPNQGGLIAINHEAFEGALLFAGSYNAATATAEQKRQVLASVGVSVIEVRKGSDGKWAVVANSTYNKRYTGNTTFGVSGPAAAVVGTSVVGTLNNCASGMTPWGTYLTCEETTNNYLDPTQPEQGYGWVVEIDPRGEIAGLPVKRTAMGRFDHENTAHLLDSGSNRVAFYMGDDSTPGCIYKFVPSNPVNTASRAGNSTLLDEGTLYAARFNADGTGTWVALVQGQNGLVAGAVDPGDETQGARPDVVVNFTSQADVLLQTKAAARVAGATLMDRPEWISVAPDRRIYVTLTNNGGRAVTDAANPRTANSHGHIVRWTEDGNSPLATTFRWELFALAGDPRFTAANLKGDINGDTFSSPDGVGVDPQGRLWVQTDAGTGSSITNTFGNNAMYAVDPTTKASKRFLVGPNGCEITGLTWTPDLKTFFVNIQHPNGTWPSNLTAGSTLPARSATVVVRRTDGKPIGA